MQFLLMEKPTLDWSKNTVNESGEKLGEFYTCCSEKLVYAYDILIQYYLFY